MNSMEDLKNVLTKELQNLNMTEEFESTKELIMVGVSASALLSYTCLYLILLACTM